MKSIVSLLSLGLILEIGSGLSAVHASLSDHPSSLSPEHLAQASLVRGVLTADSGSRINVRSGPNTTSSSTVHHGIAGDPVAILRSEKVGDPQQNQPLHVWHRVSFLNSGSTVVGWVRGDFVVNLGSSSHVPVNSPVSEACHQTLAQARTEISNVRNSSIVDIFLISNNSPIPARPHEIKLVLGGSGQAAVLSSPKFMLRISNDLIQGCDTGSSIRFAADQSGWDSVYGIVDGRVANFTCVDPLSSPFGGLRWESAEYYCD